MNTTRTLIGVFLLLLMLAICGCQSAQKDFDEALKTNTEQAYREFLEAHAHHPLTEEAKKRLEAVVFESVIRSDDEMALVNFLGEFQDSLHRKQVKIRLRNLLWPKQPSSFRSTVDIKFTVKSLVFSDIKNGLGRLLEGDMTVQPVDGKAMDLTPVFEEGKLLGRAFDVDQLLSLRPGEKIAVYDARSWHVVTVTAPLKDDKVGIEECQVKTTGSDEKETTVTVHQLRLIDSERGKAGLVWDLRTALRSAGK